MNNLARKAVTDDLSDEVRSVAKAVTPKHYENQVVSLSETAAANSAEAVIVNEFGDL